MKTLDNKVALITGGSRGIGAAIATRMKDDGATVVTADLAGAEIDCDVRDPTAVQAAVERVVCEQGRLDVVVANAGVSGPVAPIGEVTYEQWREVQSVNLDGVFHTFRAGSAAMAESGGGVLLAVASIMGIRPGPLAGAYSAAKAGAISLVRSYAIDMRAAGIRANAVCPGFVDTDLVRANQEGLEDALGLDSLDAVVDQIQGRMATPQDVAALAAFLASDRVAFMNGGVYTVDGGLSGNLV